MKVDDTAYAEALEYLAKYGEDDWMMLSVVVSEAHGVLESPSSRSEVLEATLLLAGSLVELGVVPGDLVADDRNFVPWPGPPARQLRRLRSEMNAMLERDELPIGPEICWFHKIDS